MGKHIVVYLVLWASGGHEVLGAWGDWIPTGVVPTDYIPGLNQVSTLVQAVKGIATTVDKSWETFSDTFVKTADSMSGALRNLADEVDVSNLNEFAEKFVVPVLVQKIGRSCVQGVEVKLEKSYLLLNESILRMKPRFTTGANIVNDAREKTMDVEIYFELQKARIQYSFRFKNDIILYNLDKSGKLLLTMRKNIRISLFGVVTKKLSQFKELRDTDGSCVVRLEKVKTTISGYLEHTKIKYYSVGIKATQRFISGAIRAVEDQLKDDIGKSLSYIVEKELRQLKFFCAPSNALGKLICNQPVFKSVVKNGR